MLWHGWHAFRRGIATTLYELGVPDKTIQDILRHANLKTTMGIYVKARREKSVAAMVGDFTDAVIKAKAQFSDSVREVEMPKPTLLN